MYAKETKSKENTVRAVANSVAQEKNNVNQGVGLTDNRNKNKNLSDKILLRSVHQKMPTIQKDDQNDSGLGSNIAATFQGFGLIIQQRNGRKKKKKKRGKLRIGLEKAKRRQEAKKSQEHTRNARPSTRNKHQEARAARLLQTQNRAWRNFVEKTGQRISFGTWKKRYWNK